MTTPDYTPGDPDPGDDPDDVMIELTKNCVVLGALMESKPDTEPRKLRLLACVALDHLEVALHELEPTKFPLRRQRLATS